MKPNIYNSDDLNKAMNFSIILGLFMGFFIIGIVGVVASGFKNPNYLAIFEWLGYIGIGGMGLYMIACLGVLAYCAYCIKEELNNGG